MLLEKWFRSEAQQEIRVQLKQASDNVEHLLTRLKSYEDRLVVLRSAVKDLVLYIQQQETAHHLTLTSQRNNQTTNNNTNQDDDDNDDNDNESKGKQNHRLRGGGVDEEESLERNREEVRKSLTDFHFILF